MARPEPAGDTFPRIPYAQWRNSLGWRQGEHLAAIGPTECGKTTVMRDLLKDRSHVVLFGTKVRDKSLDKYLRDGYRRVGDYADTAQRDRRIALWPRASGPLRQMSVTQSVKFREALDVMFREGGWTVAADELHYLCKNLGLQHELETYFHQGRSAGLTVAYGTQRPAWIPVVAYSAITHGLFWKTGEPGDAKRLAAIARSDPRRMATAMDGLGPHEFIAVNTRAGGSAPVITEYDMKRG